MTAEIVTNRRTEQYGPGDCARHLTVVECTTKSLWPRITIAQYIQLCVARLNIAELIARRVAS